MDINDLIGKKKEVLEAADAIKTRVFDAQGGEWRGDDTAKFDSLIDEAEKISGTMARLAKLDSAQRAVETASETQGRKTEPSRIPESRSNFNTKATKADADMAIRGWLLAGRNQVTDAHRNAATKMGINLNSNELNINLFGREPLRSRRDEDVRSWEKMAWETRAAMGSGSTTIGGFTVPDAPMGSLEEALLAFGGMRQTSTIIRTDSGADLPIPTNDDTGNKGARLGENTQVSEVDPTVGQLVLQAYKYSSKSVLCSVEFLQDTSIDAMGFIMRKLTDRIGRIQNDEFTVGTGVSQPNGIVVAATSSSVTAGGQTTCTYDNILDLIHTIDPAYRENGKFMLHDSALKMIKKVKIPNYSGDTGGTPLWIPGLNNLGDSILGYPYVINQSIATVATGTKSVLFGDLSKYLIRDCREVTLVRLDERYADYHQVGFLAFARSDGDLLDAGTHPVKYMTQA